MLSATSVSPSPLRNSQSTKRGYKKPETRRKNMYPQRIAAIAFCIFLSQVLAISSWKSKQTTSHEGKYREVEGYRGVADDIIAYTTQGKGRHQAYNRLAEFVDKFGSRFIGTQNLENAIDYMLKNLTADGLENVHGEEIKAPHWIRGNESVELLQPRYLKMSMLGLGYSVGTDPEGITAEVLVVHSFDELHKRAAEAKGKIVVFDQGWVSYPVTVAYRSNSASEAAKVGAVAALVRSVTPFSINSPHTGMMYYSDATQKIPTACITVEDAEMLSRMAARGTKIVIRLKMEAKMLGSITSRNTVAEITGSKYPEQVVLVSGHLDSWDVGQGAMDDGGGAFISWQALSIIKYLNLRPKRTMRVVLWTAEEMGLVGSQQYYEAHKGDVKNFDLVMESDEGTFTPNGLDFQGSDEASVIMEKVLELLAPINASKLTRTDVGGDIGFWVQKGVPGGSLDNQNEKYFYFHHSDGDMMTVQDPDQMDLCSAVWAVVAFVVADMEEMLPR